MTALRPSSASTSTSGGPCGGALCACAGKPLPLQHSQFRRALSAAGGGGAYGALTMLKSSAASGWTSGGPCGGAPGMRRPSLAPVTRSVRRRRRRVGRVDDAEVGGGERVELGRPLRRRALRRAAQVAAQARLQALLDAARGAADAPPQRQLPQAQARRVHRVQVVQVQTQAVRIACGVSNALNMVRHTRG